MPTPAQVSPGSGGGHPSGDRMQKCPTSPTQHWVSSWDTRSCTQPGHRLSIHRHCKPGPAEPEWQTPDKASPREQRAVFCQPRLSALQECGGNKTHTFLQHENTSAWAEPRERSFRTSIRAVTTGGRDTKIALPISRCLCRLRARAARGLRVPGGEWLTPTRTPRARCTRYRRSRAVGSPPLLDIGQHGSSWWCGDKAKY